MNLLFGTFQYRFSRSNFLFNLRVSASAACSKFDIVEY